MGNNPFTVCCNILTDAFISGDELFICLVYPTRPSEGTALTACPVLKGCILACVGIGVNQKPNQKRMTGTSDVYREKSYETFKVAGNSPQGWNP